MFAFPKSLFCVLLMVVFSITIGYIIKIPPDFEREIMKALRTRNLLIIPIK